MSDASGRVGRARGAASSAESAAIYAEWAASYDADVFEVLGFTGSTRIADLLAAHVDDRSVDVLDIGCGTGAVGCRLFEHGFTAIDGVDLSPEMLDIARRKRCYRRLDLIDLTVGAALPGDRYAASVSAGTFTSGHVGPTHLGPILAAHRPGATLAWVVAAPLWSGFEDALRVASVAVVSAELEAVRCGGPSESRMVVGRVGI